MHDGMVALLEETDVVNKVLEGARITQDDARELYAMPLNELGALADFRRNLAKKDSGHGLDVVTYIVDRNINYTNVCNVYCKFCAFYRTEKDDDHYVLSEEQLDKKLDELTAEGGVQVLLQGGHHSKLGIDFYLNMISHIREKYPHINARVQPAGVQSLLAGLRHVAPRGHHEIHGSGPRVDPRRRRRDPRRPHPQSNRPAQAQ